MTPGHVLCGANPCNVAAGNKCCMPLGGIFGGGFPTCLPDFTPCVDTDVAPTVEIKCDGPEDCHSGDVCCGEFELISTGPDSATARYERLECQDSCGSIEDGETVICGNADAACRPGQICSDSTVIDDYRVCINP